MEKENRIVIGKKYLLHKKIGEGSFGSLHRGYDIEKTKGDEHFNVAIKLEKKNAPMHLLTLEYKTYKYLYKEGINIPKMFWYGEKNDYYVLVMELLGHNLQYLLTESKGKFSLKTICIIAQQIIRLIFYIHSKGIIHRDIKPENFLLGLNNNNIYMIDFGLSKAYKISKTEHIPFSDKKKLIGTLRYTSLNSHKGFEQSRRDDLESIGYMLIYFYKGVLPWQGLSKTSKTDKYRAVFECKRDILTEELCSDMPLEFKTYMDYVRELKFDEKPNYTMLYKLFGTILENYNLVNDGITDWSKIDSN